MFTTLPPIRPKPRRGPHSPRLHIDLQDHRSLPADWHHCRDRYQKNFLNRRSVSHLSVRGNTVRRKHKFAVVFPLSTHTGGDDLAVFIVPVDIKVFCPSSSLSKFLQSSLLSGAPSVVYLRQRTGIPSTGSLPEYRSFSVCCASTFLTFSSLTPLFWVFKSVLFVVGGAGSS